jgi:ribA/ribD-fused uncharacterized protein
MASINPFTSHEATKAPVTNKDMYVFFWKPEQDNGFLSQWYNSPFIYEGKGFTTAEQFMMYKKAELFKDYVMAEAILTFGERHPATHREMGRLVSNYDDLTWINESPMIVRIGNLCKFTQNIELKNLLLNTGDKIIVEASAYDKIWGIGFNKDNAIGNEQRWGSNKLGLALMDVRKVIREKYS